MAAADIDVDTVLVPVDGSEAAAEAAERAAAVADRYGATLHVLYVLGEAPSRGLETGEVDPDHVARESEEFLADVRAVAPDHVEVHAAMAFGFSTHRKSVHPGSVILDSAEEVDADFLVVPRSVSEGTVEVLEKAAEYVLLYASQPVLSV